MAMRMRVRAGLVAALFLALAPPLCLARTQAAEPLSLDTRTRVETAPGSGRFHVVHRPETWDPAKTAIIICDMWDKHWCKGATRRVAEMAPRMNEVIRAARDRGVLIIHCPSDTMKYYNGTPARQLAQSAPKAEGRPAVPERCTFDFRNEAPLPIDFSDDGCDCQPMCPHGNPWRRQIDILKIEEGDAVTDSVEAFDLMRSRGIDNVIVMGVHTNICVLGRPFSIRRMVELGQRVVLMRDMTDTMYNSRRPPYVSHFTGTDLVIEHIEKYWCPTITSASFLGGDEFRFGEDRRKHMAIVMAEDEYQAEETVPRFAYRDLGQHFRISLVFGDEKNKNSIPGLEVLDEADAAIIYVRRRLPTTEQLAHLRAFVAAGKPIVGIRTASHAFAARDGKSPPAGHDAWPEFDQMVLGGNYHNHHGNKKDPATIVWTVPEGMDHPVMKEIPTGQWTVPSWLYKTSPLEPNATLLMMGQVPGRPPDEPVTWTFLRKEGGRSFYTSLGHAEEFERPEFRRLLVNGIFWSLGTDVPADWREAPTDSPAPPLRRVSAAGLLDRLRIEVEQTRAQRRNSSAEKN